MIFETPSLPFMISLYLNGSGGGGVADITWNGPFCVDRKAEYGATHKLPVKKRELHLKHIQILIMS